MKAMLLLVGPVLRGVGFFQEAGMGTVTACVVYIWPSAPEFNKSKYIIHATLAVASHCDTGAHCGWCGVGVVNRTRTNVW